LEGRGGAAGALYTEVGLLKEEDVGLSSHTAVEDEMEAVS
jgi:hypothetical protein